MAFRKTPQLKSFDYQGTWSYHVTIVTADRRNVFRSRQLVDEGVRQLMISAGKHGFKVWAYCFMPDHLHLLISGDRWSELRGFVQHFKQLTGYDYKGATGHCLWQPGFWDRVLRCDEDLHDAAEYIWANPSRAGLTSDWREYFGSGPRPMPDWI